MVSFPRKLSQDEWSLTHFSDIPETLQDKILIWRNDPRIRRWMTSRRKIKKEEHAAFLTSLVDAEDRAYYLVRKETSPVGVVSLTTVDFADGSASIGLYKNPDTQERGVGPIFVILLERLAAELGLRSLRLEVVRRNSRAVELYTNSGYRTRHASRRWLRMEKDL
jgi:UDP-4-amino-4,6-dideoxy-N-acetyl-beta-L-altrosamine N-acetyltransferase